MPAVCDGGANAVVSWVPETDDEDDDILRPTQPLARGGGANDIPRADAVLEGLELESDDAALCPTQPLLRTVDAPRAKSPTPKKRSIRAHEDPWRFPMLNTQFSPRLVKGSAWVSWTLGVRRSSCAHCGVGFERLHAMLRRDPRGRKIVFSAPARRRPNVVAMCAIARQLRLM